MKGTSEVKTEMLGNMRIVVAVGENWRLTTMVRVEELAGILPLNIEELLRKIYFL